MRRLVFRTGAPLTRGQVGMYFAHFGVGIFMLGATVASAYKLETDVSARPGDTVQAGGYEFVFKNMRQVEGANFLADEGEFELRNGGELVVGAEAADSSLHGAARAGRQRQRSTRTSCATCSSRSASRSATTLEPAPASETADRLLWLGSGLMALGGPGRDHG